MLALVVGLDIDNIRTRLLNGLDLDGLAVAAGHAVALAFGCLEDKVDAAVVGKGLVQREGERRVGADDGGGRRRFHFGEGRRHQYQITAELHDPEVEPLEKVQFGDLSLVSEHGLGVLAQRELVPDKDLLIGQGLPLGGDHLHGTLVLGLVHGADAAAVSTVLDELAAFDFRCGNALDVAGHLFECDGGDVFYKRLRLKRLMDLRKIYRMAIAINAKAAVPV